MTKMIPPVPTSAVMMPTPKQKIGFSIESIVGNDANTNSAVVAGNNSSNNSSTATGGPSSPPQTPPQVHPSLHQGISSHQHHHHHQHQHHQLLQHHSHQPQSQHQHQLHHHLPAHMTTAIVAAATDHQHSIHQQILQHQGSMKSTQSAQQSPPIRHDIQDIINRLHNSAAAANLGNSYSPPHQTRLSSPDEPIMHLKRERSPTSACIDEQQNPAQRHQPPHTPPQSVSPNSSLPSPPPPAMVGSSPSGHQNYCKGPIMVPGMPPSGLVRPFPVGPPPPPHRTQNMPDIKALPPYINAPPEMQPQHNPHLLAAAQFQMAAALQAGHVLGPAAAAAAAAGLPPHSPFLPNSATMPRESYPLYPWLLSRHGRIFPHRFPGNFLLQPFRKPKRIRTAFSPSQLLKLEHAFESNQYVVGAERKALAQSLNLSETQVKVWFQNRRTKHKRMQQEDEKGANSGNSDKNSQNASCDEDDDELIDMEMDDCPSEDELETSH